MIKFLLLISLALASTNALYNVKATPIYAIDFTSPNASPIQAVYNCLKTQNLDFLNLQVWEGEGLNPQFNANWNKAKAAGIEVGPYASVCNNCTNKTPLEVCESIAEVLPEKFEGIVWFKLKDCDGCWKGTPTERFAYLTELAKGFNSLKVQVGGIFNGKEEWTSVFGSPTFDDDLFRFRFVWYIHHDGVEDFSDWKEVKFGRWKLPVIKQYKTNVLKCGAYVNLSVAFD